LTKNKKAPGTQGARAQNRPWRGVAAELSDILTLSEGLFFGFRGKYIPVGEIYWGVGQGWPVHHNAAPAYQQILFPQGKYGNNYFNITTSYISV